MKVRLKLAQKPIPFKVNNFDIDFEERLGTFTIYADFSVDAINLIAGKQVLEREVDYPYILRHPKLIYSILDNNMNIWLNSTESSKKGLLFYVLQRFRQMYGKGQNTGGFEISTSSKWRISSLSYTGIELDGDPVDYDVYFSQGIVKLKVFGEFALRQV